MTATKRPASEAIKFWRKTPLSGEGFVIKGVYTDRGFRAVFDKFLSSSAETRKEALFRLLDRSTARGLGADIEKAKAHVEELVRSGGDRKLWNDALKGRIQVSHSVGARLSDSMAKNEELLGNILYKSIAPHIAQKEAEELEARLKAAVQAYTRSLEARKSEKQREMRRAFEGLLGRKIAAGKAVTREDMRRAFEGLVGRELGKEAPMKQREMRKAFEGILGRKISTGRPVTQKETWAAFEGLLGRRIKPGVPLKGTEMRRTFEALLGRKIAKGRKVTTDEMRKTFEGLLGREIGAAAPTVEDRLLSMKKELMRPKTGEESFEAAKKFLLPMKHGTPELDEALAKLETGDEAKKLAESVEAARKFLIASDKGPGLKERIAKLRKKITQEQ